MAAVTIHSVPGLPDCWSVLERRTGVVRYLPKIDNRHLMNLDGAIARFETQDEANQAIYDLISRMQ